MSSTEARCRSLALASGAPGPDSVASSTADRPASAKRSSKLRSVMPACSAWARKGLGHAVQAQGVQLLQGLLIQHEFSSRGYCSPRPSEGS